MKPPDASPSDFDEQQVERDEEGGQSNGNCNQRGQHKRGPVEASFKRIQRLVQQ
jgi:hypothetical protein